MALTTQLPSGFDRLPFASLAFWAAIAVRTFSRPRPYPLNCVGLTLMRTAGAELPPTMTWPTPPICDNRCSRMVDAASYSADGGSLSDVKAMIMMGASAGLTFR